MFRCSILAIGSLVTDIRRLITGPLQVFLGEHDLQSWSKHSGTMPLLHVRLRRPMTPLLFTIY